MLGSVRKVLPLRAASHILRPASSTLPLRPSSTCGPSRTPRRSRLSASRLPTALLPPGGPGRVVHRRAERTGQWGSGRFASRGAAKGCNVAAVFIKSKVGLVTERMIVSSRELLGASKSVSTADYGPLRQFSRLGLRADGTDCSVKARRSSQDARVSFPTEPTWHVAPAAAGIPPAHPRVAVILAKLCVEDCWKRRQSTGYRENHRCNRTAPGGSRTTANQSALGTGRCITSGAILAQPQLGGLPSRLV